MKQILIVIFLITQTELSAQVYANLSFSDDFSGAGTALSSNWATSFANAAGRIERRNLAGSWPQFGTTTGPNGTATSGNGMAIYNTSNLASNNTLRADLYLRLLNVTNARIQFSIVDWGTAHSANPLNVLISTNGGASFGATSVTVPLNLAPYSDGVWNNVSVDLNDLATSNGLTLSNTTVVRLAFTLRGSGNTTNPKSGTQFVYLDNFSATGSTPLPVEMLSFTAKKTGNKNQLNWVTLSEINNSHFEIQKSTNGIDFETIGEVLGNGSSNAVNTYQFNDYDIEGDEVYYRLRQIDYNGEFSFSAIEQIVSEKELSLFFHNSTVYCIGCGKGVLILRDKVGKEIDRIEKESSAQEHVLHNHLSAGVYYLQFVDTKQRVVLSSKILINN